MTPEDRLAALGLAVPDSPVMIGLWAEVED